MSNRPGPITRNVRRVRQLVGGDSEVNSSRVYLGRQVRAFARRTEAGMLVLDAGAGRAPYRRCFDHARYETADFARLSMEYAPLDYVCELTDIPVEDGRFDRVLFNQVLEHLPEPGRVLAELHRVLRPGGLILCSAPLFFAEHQVPHDYFRYTKYALRRLFDEAGFEVVRISWLEGYFGTVSYQFQVMHRSLPGRLADIRAIESGWRVAFLAPLLLTTRALAGVLGRAFGAADVRWRYTKSGLPKNYVVLARKPDG